MNRQGWRSPHHASLSGRTNYPGAGKELGEINRLGLLSFHLSLSIASFLNAHSDCTSAASKHVEMPAQGLLLGAVNKDSLLQRLEGLRIRFASGLAKDQLSLQAPLLRHVPSRCNLLVDQGGVVLQIGAKAFLFESGPHYGEMLSQPRLSCDPGGQDLQTI